MAQNGPLRKDPWKELAARKGTRQVELGEVLARLSVEDRAAQALKKELLQRVAQLARRP